MKLFLRYQLTGSVFIGWFVVLYYGGCSANLQELIEKLAKLEANQACLSLFAAYPIGVIIHQFSVLLKNLVFANFFQSLSDKPLLFCNKEDKGTDFEPYKYYMDKISNLNTFYYVRFDNGFLSPLLATLFYKFTIFENIAYTQTLLHLKILFALVSIITLVYICRIIEELRVYYAKINPCSFQGVKSPFFICYIVGFSAVILFILAICLAI